jgi:hypothetical protein
LAQDTDNIQVVLNKVSGLQFPKTVRKFMARKDPLFPQSEVQHKYSKTNVIHFLFNLLRIKGLYIFLELLVYL